MGKVQTGEELMREGEGGLSQEANGMCRQRKHNSTLMLEVWELKCLETSLRGKSMSCVSPWAFNLSRVSSFPVGCFSFKHHYLVFW